MPPDDDGDTSVRFVTRVVNGREQVLIMLVRSGEDANVVHGAPVQDDGMVVGTGYAPTLDLP